MLGWLRRLQTWILKAKLLWLTLIILIVCLWVAFLPDIAEPQIRLVGLFLQLFGILVVLIGILDLRKLFNQPPLFAVASQWLMSFPKFRLPKVTAHLTAELGAVTLAGRATLSHRAGPNATIEDRV